MKTNMVIIKAKKNEVICKCGGEVMIDGTMTYQLPYGIGFHEDGACYIDSIKMKGWHGVCLKCNRNVFGYTSRKLHSKEIAKVNNAA